IANPVVRVRPDFIPVVDIDVVHWLDSRVDTGIDGNDLPPEPAPYMLRPKIARANAAFGRIGLAEIIMPDGLRSQAACQHRLRSSQSLASGQASRKRDRIRKQRAKSNPP